MKAQQGVALVMVVIVLAILLVMSIALMQSTNIANVVAGNIAFKEAANAASNVGINDALSELSTRTDFIHDVAGEYYAYQQATDSNGLPTSVDWTTVPSTTVQGYKVQHMTERLCNSITSLCVAGKIGQLSSNKLGSQAYTNGISYFYRVTVLVSGPKNTVSYVQVLLKK